MSVDSTHNGFPIVQSYEDLVRHYVESTLTAAVTYAQETELSRRVREWEERIKPRLLAEVGVSFKNISLIFYKRNKTLYSIFMIMED